MSVKIKIFNASITDNSSAELENLVNSWLEENQNINLLSVTVTSNLRDSIQSESTSNPLSPYLAQMKHDQGNPRPATATIAYKIS